MSLHSIDYCLIPQTPAIAIMDDSESRRRHTHMGISLSPMKEVEKHIHQKLQNVASRPRRAESPQCTPWSPNDIPKFLIDDASEGDWQGSSSSSQPVAPSGRVSPQIVLNGQLLQCTSLHHGEPGHECDPQQYLESHTAMEGTLEGGRGVGGGGGGGGGCQISPNPCSGTWQEESHVSPKYGHFTTGSVSQGNNATTAAWSEKRGPQAPGNSLPTDAAGLGPTPLSRDSPVTVSNGQRTELEAAMACPTLKTAERITPALGHQRRKLSSPAFISCSKVHGTPARKNGTVVLPELNVRHIGDASGSLVIYFRGRARAVSPDVRRKSASAAILQKRARTPDPDRTPMTFS